ncbi:adenylate/guanylate cyclase domain-containing protein [Candidatus Fermentibacteria bacterium]|nr:adenylate/guanylate cyclase domain-containing protein [Candidatus Fermentibacteria bacterium]
MTIVEGSRKWPLWLRITSLAFSTAVVIFAVTRLGFLQTIENRTLDLRFVLQPTPAAGKVVIVAVDGTSLDRLDYVSWPWPRQIYADCIGLLRRWEADVIAFDIIFADPSQYGAWDDFSFRDSMAAFGGAVLAMPLSAPEGFVTPVPRNAVMDIRGDLSGLDSAWSCEPPLDSLLPAVAALGNVTASPDPDGVYRSVTLFTDTPEGPVPSLAFAAAWLAAGRPAVTLEPGRLVFGDTEIPLDGRYRMRPRFRGPTGTITTVPIADLLESLQAEAAGGAPVVDPGLFRDAVVIIGYTAPGLYDLKPTPYSGRCPGMEINATAVDNLLSGVAIERPGSAAVLAATLAVSLLCASALLVKRSVIIQVLLGLLVLGAYAALAFLLFEMNVWIETLAPLSAGVLSILGGSAVSYSHANRQRKQITLAFSQYLSPELVRQLARHPEKLRLGGEEMVMTAHFSDLAGFTSFSEKLSPKDLVHLLNRYLTLMTDLLMASGATLDKYIGDAVVAFWGAPFPQEDSAVRACRAVLEMRRALAELNAELEKEGLPLLNPRTGLNTGLMVVGNMGSSRRFDYTMMGSAVNLASRLEGVNKFYGTSIMVSRATKEAAGSGFVFRELDSIRVVGQKTPVDIFELCGFEGDAPEEILARHRAYAEALSAYRDGRLPEAAKAFDALAPDPPSVKMAARCRILAEAGLPEGWDGVFDMTSK